MQLIIQLTLLSSYTYIMSSMWSTYVDLHFICISAAMDGSSSKNRIRH